MLIAVTLVLLGIQSVSYAIIGVYSHVHLLILQSNYILCVCGTGDGYKVVELCTRTVSQCIGYI